jgi:hypothetical protein
MLLLIRSLVLGWRSKSWPSVNGNIIQSQISKVKRSQTGSLIDQYRIVIEYEYVIDDIPFKSQILSIPDQAWTILNRGLRSKRAVKQLQKKYPKDQIVTVFYNPRNPGQFVLEPVIADTNFILIFVSFLVIGGMFVAAMLIR